MCADVLVFCAHTLLFCICVRVVRGVHKHQGLQMTGSVRVFRWQSGCALISLVFVHTHTHTHTLMFVYMCVYVCIKKRKEDSAGSDDTASMIKIPYTLYLYIYLVLANPTCTRSCVASSSDMGFLLLNPESGVPMVSLPV
jgi:hypothetical protein